MANWWDADPVVPSKQTGAAANWWESDPIAKSGIPTPATRRETFPEEKPTFAEALTGRGEQPKTSIALGGAKIAEPAPRPATEEELAKAALSGRTVEQMRAGAAAEEIPQTGDLRPVTGREGTQTTYNRLLDFFGGVLTPEQSAAAKQERVQPLREAADLASAAVPLAREKQERAMAFKDENGVPLIDKVTQLMQIRDTTTDPQEQIRAQSQIRDIVRNAPVEFRNLLVDLEGQLEERAVAARAAEVEARNAPAPTQTFARSAAETVGQTAGSQIAGTISAAQRVVLSPISLIEAVTGQEPNMSRTIDKQAKSISDALTGEFKPDEAQMNDLGMKVVSGLTSTGMFAATGPVGAGLRLSRPVSIAIAGALPEAEQGWQEAQRRAKEDPSLDQEWRRWWSFTNRALTGGTEAIPISNLFRRLEQASGGGLTRAVGIMAANGGEEMVQQGLQDTLNNLNAILLLKDPNATITKDVADNMIVAGLTGALFAGGAVSAKALADLRDVYKTPEQAPVTLRDILFPKDPAQNESEMEAAIAEEPGEGQAAAPKETAEIPENDLNDVAVLKAAGRDFEDITMMSKYQRRAEAKALREEEGIQPAPLTEEEIRYFIPEEEAPAAPSSPEASVEARGPEGVLPSPSAPPAAPAAEAPSQRAIDLVEQGVPPLEAMQEAAQEPVAPPPPQSPIAAPAKPASAKSAAAAPITLDTVKALLPTDSSGSPDYGYLQQKIAEIAGPNKFLKDLTPEQGQQLISSLGGAAAPAAVEAPAPAKPVKFSASEAKKNFNTASTGKPFKATLIRGQGAAESPYNEMGVQEPILGEGLYTTHDEEYASNFGPNITEHQVSLNNPLVIETDNQWRDLTKRAGWSRPNPIGADKQQTSKDIARLRQMLVNDGHDGVVVLVPPDERRGKTLQNVFGADQVIEFNVQKPAPVPAVEKPEPIVEAPKPEKKAKVEKPTKQPAAKAVEAPAAKMESVKGNTYGSMAPKRFISMMGAFPSFGHDVKGKTPLEAGTGAIKVRVDPTLLKNGGKMEDAIAAIPAAVKEVIVGKDAYKGLKQNQVAELNNALAKIEAAGGKVTLEGEPPTFSKVKRSRPTRELGAYVASIGGIKGYNPKTGKLSQEYRRIGERRIPGLIRKNGGREDMWTLLQEVVDPYYPEWKGIINQTRRYDDDSQQEKIQTFLDDLEAGGVYPNGERRKGELRQASIEDQEDFYDEISANLRADLNAFGIKEYPEVFNVAVQILARGEVKDGYEAYELATLEVAMEDPSILEPVIYDITGDDYWSTVAEQRRDAEGEAIPAEPERMEADFAYETEQRPAPEAGAIRREDGKREEEPAAKAAPEGAGKRVQEPVSGKDEAEGLTAEEAQKILDDKLRPGYKVRLSDKTERFPAGHTLLITSPTERGKSSGAFPLPNNKKELTDWIKGTIRVLPEEAKKPAEEKGADNKPQLVVPGAEKISDKELAERKAAAPMRAKVEQKEAGGLFGDARLQQDIFDSVQSKPAAPVAKEEPVPNRPKIDKWADDLGRELQRRPVFSNEDVALLYRPEDKEYIAVTKDKLVTPNDIQEYQSKGPPKYITEDQFQLLLRERRNAEKLDNELYNANPDGPFANSDFVASENFPKEIGKVAVEWAKLANLPKGTRILFTTVEDAYNMDVHGNYRIINSGKIYLGEKVGVKVSVKKPNDESLYHVILMKEGLPKSKALETLSHELGHIIQDEIWEKVSPETKDKIKSAHREWRKKAESGTVAKVISGRAYRTQQLIAKEGKDKLQLPASDMSASSREYHLSFNEWFADQTARYFNSQEKPLSVVDKFFKRIADALRRFYSSIKGQAYVPDKEFKRWLDKHIDSVKTTIQNEADVQFKVTVQAEEDIVDRSNTPTYTVPKDGFGAQFLYGIVDKYMDGTRIQRAIEAVRGSKLPDSLDIEMSIQLMQDKAIAKQQQFYDKMVRPMVAFMQAHKITGDELGRFLYAQHAPERNARMAQRDPSRFDGTNGSGLTTQEAQDYLASIPPERLALLKEAYNKHVKQIIKSDLEYRVNNALLTAEQYESYIKPFSKGGYDFYVPLQGYAEDGSDTDVVEADPFIPNIGRGFAVWGKEYKLAAGRSSKAMNPLYSSIQKRMDGIVRVEKNKTDKVLWDLFRNYPNPEIATLHTDANLPKRPVLRADGTIQYVPDFAMARAEETLALKVGGRQAYIIFNRDNPTSKRFVHSLKGMVGDDVGIAGRTLLATGRFMSNINTQWVPDFFITNMPRDVQDALVSIYSTKEGFATNFVKEFMRSGNIVRKVAMGQTLTDKEQQHYDEWIQSGGRLDFGGFATIEKTSEKLQKEFGDLFDAGRTDMQTLERYFRKSGELTLGAVERFNQLFDDVVRFSVYRAARSDPDNRFSKDRAAQLARRATVDFRQRGAKMPYLNALYPYLSAGINGQRNFIRVLKSRRGRMALSTLVLMGIANSLLGVALSEDDETDPTKKKFYTQVNDWERAKSFVIPIPINGKYRKISLGFMGLFAFGLGDQIVGYMTGNVKAGDAAINVTKSLASSFIPFWSGGAVDSITPWVLQAPIELWYNKNWLGNPIYPERDTRMPQSSQSFESTPSWAKAAAEFANDWSGGSYTEPGWVDVYPATLDYFAKFLTQGLGTFSVASFEPFRAFMNGEDLEAEKLPFLRRTTVKDTADRTEYYETRNSIKAGVAQARELRKIIVDPKATREQKEEARATMRNLTKELGITLDMDGVRVKNSLADIFDKTDDRIKKLNDEIKSVQENKTLTTQEKAEKIKVKEETKRNIMNNARRRYIQKNESPPSPFEQLKDYLR